MNRAWNLKWKRLSSKPTGRIHYMKKDNEYVFESKAYNDLYLVISEYEPVSVSMLYVNDFVDIIKSFKKHATIKLEISFELKAKNFELYYNMSARLVKQLLARSHNRYLFAPQLDCSVDASSFRLKLKLFEQFVLDDSSLPYSSKYFKNADSCYTTMLHHACRDDEVEDFEIDKLKTNIKTNIKELSDVELAYRYLQTLNLTKFPNMNDDDYDVLYYRIQFNRLRDSILDGSVSQLVEELKELANDLNVELEEYEIDPLNIVELSLLTLKSYISESMNESSSRYRSLLNLYNQAFDNWEHILARNQE